MQTTEKSLTLAIVVIMVALCTYFFYQTTALKHLDSVFLFESTLAILKEGHPISGSVGTFVDALKTFALSPEAVCGSDLVQSVRGYNILDNHAYFALYPIALLTALSGPEFAFAFLNALAHIFLLAMPFVYLRMRGYALLPALAFVCCVAISYAWSYSAIGDYYLDRLYMPFALLALYLMQMMLVKRPENKRWLLSCFVALVVVGSLCTERAVLMFAGLIVFYLIFFRRAVMDAGLAKTLLVLLGSLGAYAFIYFKFRFVGIPGAGNLIGNALPSILHPLERMRAAGIKPFMLASFFPLGIFIMFAGIRHIALVIGAMLPNLLISVGGAELTGWSTHYHTMYLPFVIFAASIGAINLANCFAENKIRVAALLVISGSLFMVTASLNPYTGKFGRIFLASSGSVLGSLSRYYGSRADVPEKVLPQRIEALNTIIPQGTKVSTVESLMPVLYRSRSLSYYPIDMDKADYLVIPGSAVDGHVQTVSGAISYVGAAQATALNQCLSKRIGAKGFVLSQSIPSIGVLVFKRPG
jgi:hypothetical protein